MYERWGRTLDLLTVVFAVPLAVVSILNLISVANRVTEDDVRVSGPTAVVMVAYAMIGFILALGIGLAVHAMVSDHSPPRERPEFGPLAKLVPGLVSAAVWAPIALDAIVIEVGESLHHGLWIKGGSTLVGLTLGLLLTPPMPSRGHLR